MTDMTGDRELGARVAAMRGQRAIQQIELARLLEWTQGKLADIERGRRLPRVPDLLALASALGTTVGWLVGAEEDFADFSVELSPLLPDLTPRDLREALDFLKLRAELNGPRGKESDDDRFAGDGLATGTESS